MPEPVRVITTIVNHLGMHARPAMSFVDAASAFECDIQVKRVDQGEPVDAKSIMHLMMLAATKGTELEITCDGPDADKAAATLKALVDAGFDEE